MTWVLVFWISVTQPDGHTHTVIDRLHGYDHEHCIQDARALVTGPRSVMKAICQPEKT
jgi:hypothetical protein